VTGAMRIDPASPDPAYRQRARDAFYGDVEPEVPNAAIAPAVPRPPAHPTTVYELDSSHSPFLSMPGQVADIVVEIAS
jgi:hypothetical protein